MIINNKLLIANDPRILALFHDLARRDSLEITVAMRAA